MKKATAMMSKKTSLLSVLAFVLSKRKEIPVVCVFAPMFTKENERDGYIQRIKAIDDAILAASLRIYLSGDLPAGSHPEMQWADDAHLELRFNSRSCFQLQCVFMLVRLCKTVYCHSLLRFMPNSVNERLLNIFRFRHITTVWDVHGAVPEECSLTSDEGNRMLAESVEQTLWEKASVIVTVSEAMEKHLRDKHGDTRATLIVLPIFPPSLLTAMPPAQCDAKQELTIYAGGLQAWQNIALMQETIAVTSEWMHYTILVPDASAWNNTQLDCAAPEHLEITTLPPEKIHEVYAKARYGFILRDDSPINRVACPTKLVEYIAYGIIPIMKSPMIGDFVQYGLRYVSVENLQAGCMPSKTEIDFMRINNRQIVQRMKELSNSNIEQLKRILFQSK